MFSISVQLGTLNVFLFDTSMIRPLMLVPTIVLVAIKIHLERTEHLFLPVKNTIDPPPRENSSPWYRFRYPVTPRAEAFAVRF